MAHISQSQRWQAFENFRKGLLECYLEAREVAADETELPIQTFTTICPYLIEEALERDFFPERVESADSNEGTLGDL